MNGKLLPKARLLKKWAGTVVLNQHKHSFHQVNTTTQTLIFSLKLVNSVDGFKCLIQSDFRARIIHVLRASL